METGPPFYVVSQATRRSSRLQGKGSTFISQLFWDPEYWSAPGNRTRDLPLCSQALYRLSLSCRTVTLKFFSPTLVKKKWKCFVCERTGVFGPQSWGDYVAWPYFLRMKQRRVRVDTGGNPSILLLWLQSPPVFSLLPLLKEEAMSRYLLCFWRAKTSLRINWIPIVMLQFCYLRLYLGIKTFSCHPLLQMARMDVDWKL